MRTPARTPAAAGGNRVMQEAQNLMRLQAGQTPLLGGENPELHPSDFSGVTPRAAPAATPNPLAAAAAAVGATPGRSVAGVAATPSLGAGATPAHGGGAFPPTGGRAVAGISATPLLAGATPGRGGALPPGAAPTPMRDALGLNDPDSLAGAAASRREEAARLALQRNELRAGLSQLPAPRNEYQIVVPELPGEWTLFACIAAARCARQGSAGPSLWRRPAPRCCPTPAACPPAATCPACCPAEDEGPADDLEEDAADREARKRAAAEAARLAELRKRSNVMQRGLPRPASLELLPEPRDDAQVRAGAGPGAAGWRAGATHPDCGFSRAPASSASQPAARLPTRTPHLAPTPP